MPHLTTTSAREFSMHGVTFSSYAASATGARTLAAWRADFAPHTPGQPHTMTEEEVLHVLDGRLEVELDDERFTAVAGDTVLVPEATMFRITNDTSDPASAWVTSLIGMRATMRDGEAVEPPWAQ